MIAVECSNLTKRMNGRNALNKLDLTIDKDKMIGLIGRNGAGKTTLMKILAGYWKGTSGKVEVFSHRPFNSLYISANVLYVDDAMTFSQSLSLADILKEAGRAYPNWDAPLAQRLFEYFDFHPKARHRQLSKGKKSTFNMIIGLAARCELTLFDEPTSGMDASVRKDFYRALLKDYLSHPRTVIISSHHLEEIEDLLEEVVLIDEGSVFLHQPIDELKMYAKAINGRTEILKPLLAEEDVIFKREIADYMTYAVVKAGSSILDKASHSGMEITPVSPNDLCIYLTAKSKGGIDDVFK